MSLSVLIPYFPDSPERETVFHWVVDRYRLLYPGIQICLGIDYDEPFSRSKARNNAFSEATGDILIINDADTFCNKRYIDAAIDIVQSEDRAWVLPYTRYYNTTQNGAEKLLQQDPSVDVDVLDLEIGNTVDAKNHPPDGSVAGVMVVPREAFVTVGGYDEKFQGWGYEDDAFALALDTLWGRHLRVHGYVVHLWHPPAVDGDFKNPNIEANRNRWNAYKRAGGSEQKMREVLAS